MDLNPGSKKRPKNETHFLKKYIQNHEKTGTENSKKKEPKTVPKMGP